MRLIDADELKKKFSERSYWTYIHEHGDAIPIGWIMSGIDHAPTVEYPFYQEAYQTGYEEGKNDSPNFCPNCGAKMKDFTEKEIFMLSVMVNQMDYLLRVTNAVVANGERISLDDLYDLACKLGVEKFMQ